MNGGGREESRKKEIGGVYGIFVTCNIAITMCPIGGWSPHIMNMQHVEETKYNFLIWSGQIPIKTPHFNSPKLEVLEGSIFIIIF